MRIHAVVAVVALALTLSACRHTPPNLTPQAQAAFKADQVVQRIGELQDTAIALNHAQPTPLLNDHDSVAVVTFTVSALTTMRELPNGWQATVQKAYATLKQNLPPPAKQQLATVFAAVDTLLATLPR